MVLLAVAGYLVVQYVTGGTGEPGCKVVSGKGDGASYEFSPEQAVNAATITAVGTGRGLPERAVTIALATALQESSLRNIDHGDRDSLGLFQQRPSQGWGTPEEILDPTYSAGEFYDHLVKVPGYTRLPAHRRRPARAAQRLPAGLRQARAGRRAARRGPHRAVRGHADLRGPPGRDPGHGPGRGAGRARAGLRARRAGAGRRRGGRLVGGHADALPERYGRTAASGP